MFDDDKVDGEEETPATGGSDWSAPADPAMPAEGEETTTPEVDPNAL